MCDPTLKPFIYIAKLCGGFSVPLLLGVLLWEDNGSSCTVSVFWSTWPLNRCWVQSPGRAAETCSRFVDLSIQTEPSIMRVWRVCPWTPAYFISQQSLPARRVHVKTSPIWKKQTAFFSFAVLQKCTFSHKDTRLISPLSFEKKNKTTTWNWFWILPSYFFWKRQSIWKRFLAIILNYMRPLQSRPALVITFAWVSGFCPSCRCSARAGSGGKDHLDDAQISFFLFLFLHSLCCFIFWLKVEK